MEFAYDGGGLGKGGTVTLFVDGVPVGDGRVDATQAMVFSADETADVGRDTASAVSDDYDAAIQHLHRQDRVGADRPRPGRAGRGSPDHPRGAAARGNGTPVARGVGQASPGIDQQARWTPRPGKQSCSAESRCRHCLLNGRDRTHTVDAAEELRLSAASAQLNVRQIAGCLVATERVRHCAAKDCQGQLSATPRRCTSPWRPLARLNSPSVTEAGSAHARPCLSLSCSDGPKSPFARSLRSKSGASLKNDE